MKKYIPDIQHTAFVWYFDTQNREMIAKIEEIRNILEQLKDLEENRPDGYILLFNSLVFKLLFQLYHNFSVRLSSREDIGKVKHAERLTRIIEYVNQNCRTPVPIPEISAYIGLQPEYFCRFFKQNMNITFVEYLNQVRLIQMYEDLIATDYPLYQILEYNGFTNYKLFRRMFYECFHQTPMQVRSSVKKDQTSSIFFSNNEIHQTGNSPREAL